MLAYPRLRPWFEVVAAGQGVTLLSETDRFQLDGPLPLALTPLLTGQWSSDQIAEHLADRFTPALVYFHLLKLEKLGLLEDGQAPVATAAAQFLRQLGGDPARLAAPLSLNLVTLGGLDPAPAREALARQEVFAVAMADWRAPQCAPDSLWLVLTPDYLEPELIGFNRRARDQGWRWLPCKPWGIEPCFGPLFSPGPSACLECLLHRLRGHRPEEAQILRQGGDSLGLARGYSPASLELLWGLLGLELQKALSGAPQAFLSQGAISCNLKTLGLSRHLLSRRPQCPVCGDPVAWGRLPQEPLDLQPRPKSAHRDGGERIQTAAETLARLLPRVSPLSGEVGLIQDLEGVLPPGLGRLAAATWARLGAPGAPPAAEARGDLHQARSRPLGSSHGKGWTRSQARASALGEALERYSSQYCGYEPVVTARWSEVAERAIHPDRLNLFSPRQYRERLARRQQGDTAFVPEPFVEDALIDWSPAWSLSQARWKLVPAANVYYNHPPERGGLFARGDSNGVAAGNCREEACLQALCELVERDAVALWWYNRLRRRAVDQDSFAGTPCQEARAQLAARGYGLEVLDLTSDLGLPVLAAVGLHQDDLQKPPLLGFGCHFDARIALQRALGEVAQALMIPPAVTPLALARQLLGQPLGQAEFLRAHHDQPPRRAAEFANLASADFLADIQQMVARLARRGLEALLVDLTRPETGLQVVRVLAPGLMHFWPRLGAERLYRVPVEQGWLPRPLREEELNPLPFYL